MLKRKNVLKIKKKCRITIEIYKKKKKSLKNFKNSFNQLLNCLIGIIKKS